MLTGGIMEIDNPKDKGLSVRLPAELLDKMRRAAQADNRSINNWLVNKLKQLLEGKTNDTTSTNH
jgi:predicted HicB family RNase H-like nuclease